MQTAFFITYIGKEHSMKAKQQLIKDFLVQKAETPDCKE